MTKFRRRTKISERTLPKNAEIQHPRVQRTTRTHRGLPLKATMAPSHHRTPNLRKARRCAVKLNRIPQKIHHGHRTETESSFTRRNRYFRAEKHEIHGRRHYFVGQAERDHFQS